MALNTTERLLSDTDTSLLSDNESFNNNDDDALNDIHFGAALNLSCKHDHVFLPHHVSTTIPDTNSVQEVGDSSSTQPFTIVDSQPIELTSADPIDTKQKTTTTTADVELLPNFDISFDFDEFEAAQNAIHPEFIVEPTTINLPIDDNIDKYIDMLFTDWDQL